MRNKRSITWLHLSDWHQHGKDYRRDDVKRRLVDDISQRGRISDTLVDIDFLFFTGDLAFSGKAEEYRDAKAEFLEPVRLAAGVEIDHVFLVPGNHDQDLDMLELVPPAVKGLSTWESQDRWFRDPIRRNALLTPMTAYSTFVREYLRAHAPQPDPAYGYGQIVEVAGLKVGILGLNSAWYSGYNRSGNDLNEHGRLILGEPQVYDALQAIEGADLTVALLHHPFEWHTESVFLQQKIRARCHFLLCGHQHIPQLQIVRDPDSTCRIIPAGASYNRSLVESGYASGYNFVHLDLDASTGSIHMRRWRERGPGAWTEDTEAYLHRPRAFQLPQSIGPRPAYAAPETKIHEGRGTLPSPTRLKALRDQYCEWMIKDCARIRLIGFSNPRDLPDPRLDQLFVPLRADRVLPRSGVPLLEEQREVTQKTQADVQPHRLELPEARAEPVDLFPALKESRKAVILGVPGAGKSTLLRFLARSFAEGKGAQMVDFERDLLPIYIDLSGFSSELERRGTGYGILEYLCDVLHGYGVQVPPDFFRQQLQDGNCLVLLDSLDAVYGQNSQNNVVSIVEGFVHNHPNNRYIITSRVVGYRSAPLDMREFQHFRLLEFDDSQVRDFIARWCRYVEETQESAIGDKVAELLAKLERNPDVKRLAANPLMLTIVATIHRTEDLPSERVELYDKCTECLLVKWDKATHQPVRQDWEERLRQAAGYTVGEQEMRRRLEHVAWWLHTSSPESVPAGHVRRNELVAEISRFLSKRGRTNCDEDASVFLDYIEERTGILVQWAPGVYTFVHRTIQEYFAACHLAYEAGNSLSIDAMQKHIIQNLHDSHWREVILLAVAKLLPHPATLLVRSILKANSSGEDVLKRDLLFAARILADNVNIAQELAAEILKDLRQMASEQYCRQRLQEALNALAELRGDLYRQSASAALGMLIASAPIQETKAAAAEALARVGERESAIRLLSDLAENAELWHVRLAAMQDLWREGEKDHARHLLVEFAHRPGYEPVRMQAAEILWELGNKKDGSEILWYLARNAQDQRVRVAAADTIGQWGQPKEAAALLLQFAQDMKADAFARWRAAWALWDLGKKGPFVVDAIVGTGNLADQQGVETKLLQLAQREDDDFMPLISGQALAILFPWRQEQAVDLLMERARHKRGFTKLAAAHALVTLGEKLGDKKDEAVSILMELAEGRGSTSEEVRGPAARALGSLGEVEHAASILIGLTKIAGPLFENMRHDAAETLGDLGYRHPDVFNRLLEMARLKDYPAEAAYVALKKLRPPRLMTPAHAASIR